MLAMGVREIHGRVGLPALFFCLWLGMPGLDIEECGARHSTKA